MVNMDNMAIEASELAAECGKKFEGRLLAVQGAALVDLYSTFLSGFPLKARLEEMEIHGRMVLKLAEVKAEERTHDSEKAKANGWL
jgi:hypothetical protein